MLDFEYVLSALAWSIGGFILGYFTATATRDIQDIKAALVDEESPSDTRRSRAERWWSMQRIAGVFIVALAVASVTLVALTNERHSGTLSCQADVNSDLARAIQKRAEISDNDRHALDRFLLAVFALQDSDAPEKERQALYKEAVEDYRSTIEQSQKDRAETPLPSPDRCE